MSVVLAPPTSIALLHVVLSKVSSRRRSMPRMDDTHVCTWTLVNSEVTRVLSQVFLRWHRTAHPDTWPGKESGGRRSNHARFQFVIVTHLSWNTDTAHKWREKITSEFFGESHRKAGYPSPRKERGRPSFFQGTQKADIPPNPPQHAKTYMRVTFGHASMLCLIPLPTTARSFSPMRSESRMSRHVKMTSSPWSRTHLHGPQPQTTFRRRHKKGAAWDAQKRSLLPTTALGLPTAKDKGTSTSPRTWHYFLFSFFKKDVRFSCKSPSFSWFHPNLVGKTTRVTLYGPVPMRKKHRVAVARFDNPPFPPGIYPSPWPDHCNCCTTSLSKAKGIRRKQAHVGRGWG